MVVVACLLVVVAVISYQAYSYKRKTKWGIGNTSYHQKARKIESFLLNDEDQSNDVTPTASLERNEFKNEIALANF